MRPSFEVADALRLGLADYEKRHGLSAAQGKAVRAILNCRTAALGGHVRACTGCGLLSVSYNSCRHRCCPKCQGAAQAKWVERRMGELLDTQYFHLVFTVPHLLNPLFLGNDALLYNLLLRCAWQTVDELARQPRWLGAQTGMLAVLHTWGQKLDYHPHVHCIVPGGGLDAGGKWKAAKKGFFVPVRVLSALFRGKFLAGLKRLRQAGNLEYHGSAAGFTAPAAFADLLGRAYRTNWVAYAKAPMNGPAQVLRYWAATPTASPSATAAAWTSRRTRSPSPIKTAPTATAKSCSPWIWRSLSAVFCSTCCRRGSIRSGILA